MVSNANPNDPTALPWPWDFSEASFACWLHLHPLHVSELDPTRAPNKPDWRLQSLSRSRISPEISVGSGPFLFSGNNFNSFPWGAKVPNTFCADCGPGEQSHCGPRRAVEPVSFEAPAPALAGSTHVPNVLCRPGFLICTASYLMRRIRQSQGPICISCAKA